MPTSTPTVLLTGTRTSGIAVVKLATSRVDSPAWAVGDREAPSNRDRADVAVIRAQGVSINNLEKVCSRMGFKSTEKLMHSLPVGESILQGEWNRLCSHKAQGLADNDRVEGLISPVHSPSMGSLEVALDCR